ncbi:hypothetical protein L9F63_001302, partial [Diploptera punctata]
YLSFCGILRTGGNEKRGILNCNLTINQQTINILLLPLSPSVQIAEPSCGIFFTYCYILRNDFIMFSVFLLRLSCRILFILIIVCHHLILITLIVEEENFLSLNNDFYIDKFLSAFSDTK